MTNQTSESEPFRWRSATRPGAPFPMNGSRTVLGIIAAGRSRRMVAPWQDTSRRDTSAFSPRFDLDCAVGAAEGRFARKITHCPLHRGLRVGNDAPHGLLLSPPAKRTDHLLIRPHISCANDTFQTFL